MSLNTKAMMNVVVQNLSGTSLSAIGQLFTKYTEAPKDMVQVIFRTATTSPLLTISEGRQRSAAWKAGMQGDAGRYFEALQTPTTALVHAKWDKATLPDLGILLHNVVASDVIGEMYIVFHPEGTNVDSNRLSNTDIYVETLHWTKDLGDGVSVTVIMRILYAYHD